jgi:hypothetical protein
VDRRENKSGGTILKAQPKKKKAKKLTVTKVQDAVNKAIRERDEYCMIGDGVHTCKGILTASHYYPVGGNSTFRFYPPNIHAQCLSHHGIHERRQEPFFYRRWMQEHYPDDLEFMETHWNAQVRYSQPVLRDIYDLARRGALDELTEYIRALIVNG